MKFNSRQIRLTYLLTAFLASTVTLCSQNISPEIASKVAEHHLYRVAESRSIIRSFIVDEIMENYYREKLCYYTITFKDKGYVNVSATDATIPVLSYSLDRYIPIDSSASPAYEAWMESYGIEIYHVLINDVDNNMTKQIWKDYVSNDFKSKDITVGPLMTSTWGQSVQFSWQCPGYNFYIPGQSGCDCDRCAAGCVAIAMAQVLYYWSYPINVGFYTYYDWCNMSNVLDNSNTQELNAIAKLIYDCAESVDMGYCASGCSSSASTQDAVDALRYHFGYHEDVNYKRKWWYNIDTWKGFIKADINNGQPIIYRGEGSGGHAFVCDGYEEIGGNDSFHFNWGWYGDYNGFFTLDDLTPGTSNYNGAQAAIFHIKPDPNYYHDFCDVEINLFNFYLNYYGSGGGYNSWEIVPETMQRLYSCDESAPVEWRTIPSGESSQYIAHDKILLYPGFKAELGSNFIAQITPCPNCGSKEATIVTVYDDELLSTGNNKELNVNENSDISQHKEIKVYPNPNQGNFIVELPFNINEKLSVEIYNMRGEMIFMQEYKSTTKFEINISSQFKGAYLLKIYTESYKLTHSKKIVIQ